MELRIELTGTSPLLMHNPRLADPMDPIAKEMKTLTSKRKKTEDDYEQLSKLEWHGGLYTMEKDSKTIVALQTSAIRKCFIEAGKINKLGKSVGRAISFYDLNTPLIYDGPTEIDELHKNGSFTSRLVAGVGKNRVIRTRPKFYPWKAVVDALFFPDAGLNLDEVVSIVEKAGIVEGLLDNRVNGYGRFAGKVLA